MYFFLFILEILFDFSPNASYKQNRFFESLLKKGFEFILNRENGFIVFNLSFVLLPAEVDYVLEKRSCKEDILMAPGINYVKIVLALPTKVIIFSMQVLIVEIEVFDLKEAIIQGKVCLSMFLALNKYFKN